MKKLYLITGPSGVGKTTVAHELLKTYPNMERLITFVTRPPRPGEVDGIDYHFINEEQFDDMKQNGDLFEHDAHYGYNYGNSRKELERIWQAGKIPLMVLDINGVKSVEKIIPEAVSIFIKADSMEHLRARIQKRPMSEADFEKRWSKVTSEMDQAHECDFMITNEEGKLDEAVESIRRIIN